MDALKKISK